MGLMFRRSVGDLIPFTTSLSYTSDLCESLSRSPSLWCAPADLQVLPTFHGVIRHIPADVAVFEDVSVEAELACSPHSTQCIEYQKAMTQSNEQA